MPEASDESTTLQKCVPLESWTWDVYGSYDDTNHLQSNYNAVLKSQVQNLLNAPDVIVVEHGRPDWLGSARPTPRPPPRRCRRLPEYWTRGGRADRFP